VLKPGDTLGAYEIVAQLKRGGMATLYLAQRTGAAGFAKQAAVKVVHPHLADDPSFVEMFLDEARLSARIDHPNVVHVYELGEGDDGMFYLVMEYVDGCSLAQLLRALARAGRKLTPELATWIAMRVAAGLHAAHELPGPGGERLGVVHRDVSPQNILLAHRGYVKLIDFGIAKARGRSHQTSTGLVKGKFRYMSPEQAGNQPVDARTDVYALGIVLWEMLTMRRLFQADDELLLLEQIRKPQVQPPSEVASDVPEALDAVVMQALAPDPDARFPTAHAFLQALARAVPGAPALDAPDLADLLAAVLPDDDRAATGSGALPVPGRLSPDSSGGRPRPVDEALRTMTIDLSDAAMASLGETPTSGEGAIPAPVLPEDARPTVRMPEGAGPPAPSPEDARPTVRMSGPPPGAEAPTTARVSSRARSAPFVETPSPAGATAPLERSSFSSSPSERPTPGDARGGRPGARNRKVMGVLGGVLVLAVAGATVWAMASSGKDEVIDETDAGALALDEDLPEDDVAPAPLADPEDVPAGLEAPPMDEEAPADAPPAADAPEPTAQPPSPTEREARTTERAEPPKKPTRPRRRPQPKRDDGTIDGVPMMDDLDL
jgi:eukaryotic-like serine/threonine-protein kinase